MRTEFGPGMWLGRISYIILLVVKPGLVLAGAVLGDEMLMVAGVASIAAALALALAQEGPAQGLWQESHFDFQIRTVGVWLALAFNAPIVGTLLLGGPVVIAVLCIAFELALDAALLLSWLWYERRQPVPERLFHLCGIRSNVSQRLPRKATVACRFRGEALPAH